MKTHIRKIMTTGLLSLVLILPQLGYSQDNTQAPPPDDQQQPYTNPPDTPPNSDDQQLDQQEAQQAAPPTAAPVTTQVFYDQLAPYGQWVNYGDYGYVWIPSAAGPNFTPYSTEGHWVYTTYGWTWVSDYPWGWACFHYGRWSYDNNYGWFWVPGTQWGPAWVAWRHSDGYYGWAPLCPGIDITLGYGWDNRIPVNSWVFVNERFIGDRYVWQHYEPRGNNAVFIRNTSLITNTYYDRGITYSAGPDRGEVERTLHTAIRPVPVRESALPQQRYDQAHLHLYRPAIAEPTPNDHPAPARPANINQVPQRNVQYVEPQRQAPVQQRQAPVQQRQQAPQRNSAPAPSRGGYNGGGMGGGNRGGGGGNGRH